VKSQERREALTKARWDEIERRINVVRERGPATEGYAAGIGWAVDWLRTHAAVGLSIRLADAAREERK
jgi:hypothetical protein